MTASLQIPDNLLESAEQLAARRGVSRDEVVAMALEEYLEAAESSDAVTARLNAIYDHEPSDLDPVLSKLQSLAIPKESW